MTENRSIAEAGRYRLSARRQTPGSGRHNSGCGQLDNGFQCLLQPSVGTYALLPGLLQILHKLHHKSFDPVPHLGVHLVGFADGIRNAPCDDWDADAVRQAEAAHIDDQVVLIGFIQSQGLRGVTGNIDVLLRHCADRLFHDDAGRPKSRAFGDQDPSAARAGEALGHLTAAAVADAHKKNSPGSGGAHSLERKRSWTRESELSSGWKVATRWRPCSTRTGSP